MIASENTEDGIYVFIQGRNLVIFASASYKLALAA
jgi:hypothetical protein